MKANTKAVINPLESENVSRFMRGNTVKMPMPNDVELQNGEMRILTPDKRNTFIPLATPAKAK